MHREIQDLVGDRKFLIPDLLGGFLGLVVTISIMYFFPAAPFAVSCLTIVAFWFAATVFGVSGFKLIRNEGRIEKLRRKTRTWEWKNG